MEVGFIGAGRMGLAMLRNLVEAGHRVHVWDASEAAVGAAVAAGGIGASSARDALRGDAVVSMLPNDAAMRGVFTDDLLAAAPKGLVHVNMATASLACAQALTALHGRHGIAYVAAPVFGRPEMAARRELNIMAAGPAAAIDRVQPLFDAIGRKTWRLGDDPTRANVTKIAGNLLVACVIESLGEAAALARAYDMPPADLLGVVVGSLFDVPIFRIYADLVAHQRFEPAGFDLELGLKDARLALAAGEAANLPLPFASVLRDNYLDALAHGAGHQDWSAVTGVALRRAGLDAA
ncbi:oxidoreductase [Rhodoplanes elegans]|uniref:Oxidoreductase n=1 Tax=Rhodoplanes elegans TaxID=29408 RepID=A0A327KI51_9BRAD|nr:NAD(P)-dependent oxidoreductase [Rhodoplanes elegans]MBK5958384.1 oxidoreductase [Rhodoplanes elegans]RAI38137.1 oxidoreductase [Rhodoplanes elegans]